MQCAREEHEAFVLLPIIQLRAATGSALLIVVGPTDSEFLPAVIDAQY